MDSHPAEESEALRSRQVAILDLHRPEAGGPIILGVVVPILDGSPDRRAVGVVTMRLAASAHLFPFLARWPTRSATAETLLVRREGDQVLFLNDLRFRADAALSLRRPLSDLDLPASAAARGHNGVLEGLDYRGVPVLAAVTRVPESPWYLVARMDLAEIDGPARNRAWTTTALATLGLLVLGGAATLAWRESALRAARERQGAAEAARAAEVRLRASFESAAAEYAAIVSTTQDGFWVSDLDARFLDVNDALCRMLGRSRDELLTLRVVDIEALESPDEVAAHLRRLEDAGHDRFVTRHLRKDGSTIDVEVSVTYSAPLARIFAFARDVTAALQVERELRLKNDVFEASLAATSLADRDGIIRHVNPAFLRLWGYEDKPAAQELAVAAYFARPEEAGAVLRALQESGTWEGEFLARRRDGSTFLSRGMATVVRDGRGEPIGYQSTNLDVSALREAEERLRVAAETAADLMYEWDLGSSVLWFGGVDERLGYAPGEFPRTLAGWVEALHPDDRERVDAAVQAHLRDGVEYRLEYRVRAKDGSLRWWSARGGLVRRPDGTPSCWIGTVTDCTERRRAEEALRKSEHFLDSVIENCPNPMWISDSRGTLVRLNQACRDLLRVSDAELVGTYNVLEDNIVAEQGHLESVRRVFARGETARFTIDYESARLASLELGEHVALVLDVTVAPVLGPDGRVAHAIIQHVDVTQLMRTQAALRETAGRYQRLHESMREAFVLVDMSGRILETNPAYRELVGYDAEELSQLTYQDLTPTAWHAFEARLVAEQVLPRGHSDVYEKEYVRKDGRLLTVELRTFLLRGENGQPVGMWAIVRDVTERKHAERNLRESERRFRETIRSLDEAYFSVTPDGILLDHNEAFCRIMGLAEQTDCRGRQALEFWQDPEDRAAYRREMVAHGKVANRLISIRVAGGGAGTVLASAHAIRDEAGQIERFEGTFSDYTERKRAEDEIRRLNAELERRVAARTASLEAANAELEAFAHSVSHDLRAPLRHVDGFVQLLLESQRDALTDQGRHLLDTVAEAARHMGRLIDDLLRFSRTSRAELQWTPVDMNRALREVQELLAGECRDRRVEWLVADLAPAYGDAELLRLVWTHLLDNALKYTRTRAAARIEVGCRQGPEGVTYFVRDNGVGFEAAYLPKLFGVFQRLHSRTEFEGTGIGLATVRRIVSRHGGRTWAEGELDHGATFYFSLPRSEEE